MNRVKIHQGHVMEVLAGMADESVQMCCTSPPYWGLRNYGLEAQVWGDGWEGSYGLEPTIELYVEHTVEIFREVRRILRSDGVLFLNLGDSYNGSGGAGGDYNPGGLKEGQPKFPGRRVNGLKPKDLCMVPARVALALQADDWWLRSDIIWAKPNPMPESCTDRPTTAHEHIFLLTKSAQYFYDQEAVREAHKPESLERYKSPLKIYGNKDGGKDRNDFGRNAQHDVNQSGRNLRTVWEIATRSFPGAHFATFPPAIPERCIKAGTSERGACKKCLAPWTRVVEKTFVQEGPQRNRGKQKSGDLHAKSMTMGDKGFVGHNDVTTTGWTPTCTCFSFTECRFPTKSNGVVPDGAFMDKPEAIPIPCTVLDPFSGAGTTALVAAKLGRDAIGIELNPEYVEMSRKRIVGGLGMLVNLEVLSA